MVTIVNGNGGNNEGLATGWVNPQPKWYDFLFSLNFVSFISEFDFLLKIHPIFNIYLE